MKENSKGKRGRVIYYDHVPDDVYEKIVDTQAKLKKAGKRAQVSISQAITKLLKGCAV